MAAEHRLRLTLRKRRSGQEFRPVEITAAPDDHDTLQRQLDTLARDQDGRTSDGWADEYELHVEGLDVGWIDFWLAGQDR